jgi:hypothetical protein
MAGRGNARQGFLQERVLIMLKVQCTLTGVSPISFSAPIQSKKNTGESHDAFEERTWKERCHIDPSGEVYIVPGALKNCLSEVAKYLSETVPGKGKSTYTKHFEAGIICSEPLMLGVNIKHIVGERVFVPSDGRRGGTTRVWKTFPVIKQWTTNVEFLIVDPLLTDKPEKIKEYLEHAGKFIGMGRFRPRNNGYYGRFSVENFRTSKI